jgi:hypothetical protein
MKNLQVKIPKNRNLKENKVSKLSKAGMWLKENPEGVFVIKDLRAIML